MKFTDRVQPGLQPIFTSGQVLGETGYQPRKEFGPGQYLATPDPNATKSNMAAASMLESVIPTSWNLRNRALQEAFNVERSPIGGLVASKRADDYLRKFIPSLQKSRTMLAAHNLLGGGTSDRLDRSIFSDLNQGMQSAVSSGYDANQKHRTLFLDMLDSLYQNDLDMLTSTKNYVDPRAYQEADIAESQYSLARTRMRMAYVRKIIEKIFSKGMSGSASKVVAGSSSGSGGGSNSGWTQFAHDLF